jgi:hypothetical protein
MSPQANQFDRVFILTSKEELSKELLVDRFTLHYSKMSKVAIKESVEIIFDSMEDEFYRDVESFYEINRDDQDFNFRYNDIKFDDGNREFHEVFENIETKMLKFFYYGTLMKEYSWIYGMEIDDEDIDFHMLRYMHD